MAQRDLLSVGRPAQIGDTARRGLHLDVAGIGSYIHS
jgi:hypothetical protein